MFDLRSIGRMHFKPTLIIIYPKSRTIFTQEHYRAALASTKVFNLKVDVLLGTVDLRSNKIMLTQIIQWQFLGLKKHIEDEKDMFNLIEAIARMESSAKWGLDLHFWRPDLLEKYHIIYTFITIHKHPVWI
ncbi:unnamed protein product, partial [Brenthis ino]